MRVYISSDIEGMPGVNNIDQISPGGIDYHRARKFMTDHVNTAAVKAFELGAKEVLINDSHGMMQNIMIEDLDERVRLVSGNVKSLCMGEGLQEKFDVCFLLGYHPMNGTRSAALDHTMYGVVCNEIRLNDRLVGESAITGLIAGAYGTPVALISGDQSLKSEIREFFGEIEFVQTKISQGRYTATTLHPKLVNNLLADAVGRAIEAHTAGKFRPLRFDPPYKFTLRTNNTGQADAAEVMPGVVRETGFSLSFTNDNFLTAYLGLYSMIMLATTGVSTKLGK
ncbi:MAG: M55 family metallopeptidase [Planctomycetes bacterium]|nr:M55 family metallopeptidase [Planctomycetota bacterium]